MIPQLRIRTEYTFKHVYGKLPQVAQAVAAAPAAAIVDAESTWGHERWAAALKPHGVRPMYGVSVEVPFEDGRKPHAWVLARDDIGELYRFVSATDPDWRAADGKLLRFAGAALADPDEFDYVDVNPASVRAALRAVKLARSTGKPLVLTNFNRWPAPEHENVALALWDNRAVRYPGHILSDDELRQLLVPYVMSSATFDRAAQNTADAATLSTAQLLPAPQLEVPGDLDAEIERGLQLRIREGMPWNDEYAARLASERETIADKGFESYFIVVGDLMREAKRRGIMTGAARGSAAGSLVSYVLQITEVDPIKHNLLFERFMDINRGGWFFTDEYLDEVEELLKKS